MTGIYLGRLIVKQRIFDVGFVLIAMISISGCSGGGGEPSEGDILEAVERSFEDVYEMQVSAAGKDAADKARAVVNEVRKIACVKADGASGYVCDIEVDITTMFGRQKATRAARFVEGDDGWVMIEQ
jgi:hypothetical protein